MKCDLHVHTIHSGMCTVPVARRFCRESFTEPLAAYAKLKSLGMDLVTVTDHDSIDAAESLRRFPDFFLSEEVTCRMPDGAEAHIAVYDISEWQHVEIQRRRDDLDSLVSYLEEQRLLFGINHMFSGLTGRRDPEDFEWFKRAFACMETLNGTMVSRANELACQFAALHGKAMTAGSDGHTLASTGTAYTLVQGARNKREFLEGIRTRRSVAMGSSGSYWRLTRDVYRICGNMMLDQPWTVALIPLLAGVPLYLLVNYWLEVAFAERWFGRAAGNSGFTVSDASLTTSEASI